MRTKRGSKTGITQQKLQSTLFNVKKIEIWENNSNESSFPFEEWNRTVP